MTLTGNPKRLSRLRKSRLPPCAKEFLLKSSRWLIFRIAKVSRNLPIMRIATGYRLRVGDYRVFFEFDGSVHVIDIEEVKKRDERTY